MEKYIRKHIRKILTENVSNDLPDIDQVKYTLRFPKEDTLVKVDIDKLLKRHMQDNPEYAFDSREGADYPGRVDRAKEYWMTFAKDPRPIHPRTGERADWGDMKFEVPYVSINTLFGKPKLSFTDGRHRVIAMKELGYDKMYIEVPKSQEKLFMDLQEGLIKESDDDIMTQDEFQDYYDDDICNTWYKMNTDWLVMNSADNEKYDERSSLIQDFESGGQGLGNYEACWNDEDEELGYDVALYKTAKEKGITIVPDIPGMEYAGNGDFISIKEGENNSEEEKQPYLYHGTTLSNFKQMPDDKEFMLQVTPLYDDAVMYALMGGESRFLSAARETNGEDEYFDELWDNRDENEKEILKYLFPKGDKPVVLRIKNNFDANEHLGYELDIETNKSEIEPLLIDFDEYDKVNPVWATFENYFFQESVSLQETRVPRKDRIELYRDENIVIVIPLSHRALMKYATYCQLCINNPDDEEWEEYHQGKSLLVVQRYTTPPKETAKKIFLYRKIEQGDYHLDDLLDFGFEPVESIEQITNELNVLYKDINNFDTNVVLYTFSGNRASMWDAEDNEMSQYGYGLEDLPNVTPEIAELAIKGLKEYMQLKVVTESCVRKLVRESLIDEDYQGVQEMKQLAKNVLAYAAEQNIDNVHDWYYKNIQRKEIGEIYFPSIRLYNVYKRYTQKDFTKLKPFLEKSQNVFIFLSDKRHVPEVEKVSGHYLYYDDPSYSLHRDRTVTVFYGTDFLERLQDHIFESKSYNVHDLRHDFFYQFLSPLMHELQHTYDDFRSDTKAYKTKEFKDYIKRWENSEKHQAAASESEDKEEFMERIKAYLNLPHEIWARFTQIMMNDMEFTTADLEIENEGTPKERGYFKYEMIPLRRVMMRFAAIFPGYHILNDDMKKRMQKRVAQFWHIEQDKVKEHNANPQYYYHQ